jgi:hypothetical protein
MMKRDLNSRSTFSPFLPPSPAVALPHETMRVELYPQSQPASTSAQPVRFNLPRHGILASIELECSITVSEASGTNGEQVLWNQGIATHIMEYAEILNSSGLSIGRLHGEGFGFFDIQSNKMLNEDQAMLEVDHNYQLPEQRVAYKVTGSAGEDTRTFRFKLPFWFCDSPSRSLPLQFMNGDTVLQIQLKDLSNAINKTTTGFATYYDTALAQHTLSTNGAVNVGWGGGTDPALRAFVTYYLLPEQHLNVYRSAMLGSVNEWACADETRQFVSWTANAASEASSDATFKLDGIHGLASEVMFCVYPSSTKGIKTWNGVGVGSASKPSGSNLLRLEDIEIFGSGKSILGAKLSHEQLKTKIQRAQYGYSYSNKSFGKAMTSSGAVDALDDVLKDLIPEGAEQNVYVYSFSMTPTRPELNHGVLNISGIHNFELKCKFPQTSTVIYEMLFMTRNRSVVRTKPEQNGTLSMSKVLEA